MLSAVGHPDGREFVFLCGDIEVVNLPILMIDSTPQESIIHYLKMYHINVPDDNLIRILFFVHYSSSSLFQDTHYPVDTIVQSNP